MNAIENYKLKYSGADKDLIFFDFEVFPKYWLLVFSNTLQTNYISSDTNPTDKEQILDWLANQILVGFNVKGFDLKIFEALRTGKYSPCEIKELSNDIVDRDKVDGHSKTSDVYNNYKYWSKYSFIDLFDDYRNMGSLKTFESNHGLMIKESDVSFEKENLTPDDKIDIIKYCQHDVHATIKLFDDRKEYIESKLTLADMFDIDRIEALKQTNAKLSALIMNPLKAEVCNDYCFKLQPHVEEYIRKYTPKATLDYYLNTPVKDIGFTFEENDEDDSGYIKKKTKIPELNIVCFDNKIVLGSGGIHSVLEEDILCESDDNYAMYNIDVASYYPNLIIHFGYMSRLAQNKSLYPLMFEKRIKAKRNGDEKTSNALKLVLNTLYGAMKDKYNKIYDFYQASNVCIMGQLLLLSLANKLYTDLGIKIIQTNTDGILTYMSRDKLDRAKEIVKEWENMTKLEMEWEDIKKFVQKDVNNYIEVKANEQIKLKGRWVNQAIKPTNNLNAPIVHKAVVDYYTKGTSLIDTINSSTNVLDFCFTTKTGHTFNKTYHYVNNNPLLIGKVNRSVATTNTKFGTIKKVKKDKKGDVAFHKQADISENVVLVNDILESYQFCDLEIDREFYIKYAEKKLLKAPLILQNQQDNPFF